MQKLEGNCQIYSSILDLVKNDLKLVFYHKSEKF